MFKHTSAHGQLLFLFFKKNRWSFFSTQSLRLVIINAPYVNIEITATQSGVATASV